ncbi:MAG: hypothetical protein CME62_07315 [Halobacteriovoraceae bacterium]|nr:hypothetical protein [Halobacteriovoraceae bacterium]|tara:strand:- start:3996 stop:4367 length:372 start_codon:yes stop_codon:yes gene_type:complete
MSFSSIRIFCGLVLSAPIALAIVLMTWAIDQSHQNSAILVVGMVYVLVMLGLILSMTVHKLAQAEQVDYTQNKFDIIFSTLKYLDGNKPVFDHEIEDVDLDEIEFDYFPTHKPENFDQGSLQL